MLRSPRFSPVEASSVDAASSLEYTVPDSPEYTVPASPEYIPTSPARQTSHSQPSTPPRDEPSCDAMLPLFGRRLPESPVLIAEKCIALSDAQVWDILYGFSPGLGSRSRSRSEPEPLEKKIFSRRRSRLKKGQEPEPLKN